MIVHENRVFPFIGLSPTPSPVTVAPPIFHGDVAFHRLHAGAAVKTSLCGNTAKRRRLATSGKALKPAQYMGYPRSRQAQSPGNF
jgi:hypothetical protein